jgi:hypothetical protein
MVVSGWNCIISEDLLNVQIMVVINGVLALSLQQNCALQSWHYCITTFMLIQDHLLKIKI